MQMSTALKLSFCGYGCHVIGGPFISENPDCPKCGGNPDCDDAPDDGDEALKLSTCGYGCHVIGGPFISENPACPEHGGNPDCEDAPDEDDVDERREAIRALARDHRDSIMKAGESNS